MVGWGRKEEREKNAGVLGLNREMCSSREGASECVSLAQVHRSQLGK